MGRNTEVSVDMKGSGKTEDTGNTKGQRIQSTVYLRKFKGKEVKSLQELGLDLGIQGMLDLVTVSQVFSPISYCREYSLQGTLYSLQLLINWLFS